MFADAISFATSAADLFEEGEAGTNCADPCLAGYTVARSLRYNYLRRIRRLWGKA